MKTLGLSPAHDSSVCVYENGKIISFYKEERMTRQKRDTGPLHSLNEIYKNFGKQEIDAFAFCSVENPEMFSDYQRIVSKYFNVKQSVDLSMDHHLQHASLAFYNSGFESAATIVIDRNGSIFLNSAREAETIFYCEYPDNFKTVYKNLWVYDNLIYEKLKINKSNYDFEVDANSMYGIVKVYETATSLIKQNMLENGKTMGLSAYGIEGRNSFDPLFFNNTNIPIDANFIHDPREDGYASANKVLNEISSKDINNFNYEIYADYAMHVQKETQKAVAFLVEKAVNKTKSRNIVITGGYALNVVCNYYLVNRFPELNFYFEPIADDTGNSIGGAMLLYRALSKDKAIYPIKDTFFHGTDSDLSKINGKSVKTLDVAKLLIKNKSVAVFEGKAEAGPRALGHRSILFYPNNKNAKDIVNKIKKREWYRPFAAVVLEEDAEKYFCMTGIKSSEYMTISFPATDLTQKMFPGIVHVDGSCRIQTVSNSNSTLFSLLNEIKNITGHGILLNTSFNLAGEPLVESAEDAINTLNRCSLDYLWFPERGKLVE